jgi:hypothetical protein
LPEASASPTMLTAMWRIEHPDAIGSRNASSKSAAFLCEVAAGAFNFIPGPPLSKIAGISFADFRFSAKFILVGSHNISNRVIENHSDPFAGF